MVVFSLTEKEALVTSLQEQLKEWKQNEVSMSGTLLIEYALHSSRCADAGIHFQAAMIQLKDFQSEAKESLQKLFPVIPVETQQVWKLPLKSFFRICLEFRL